MTRSLLTGSLIKGSLVAATAAMVASVFAAPTALADDRRCTGTIGAASIDGNVIVPAGATCTLVGTRVDGNVLVKSNARLNAKGVRVEGNIQAENHLYVLVAPRTVDGDAVRARVNGDIQLVSGGGSEVRRTAIGGQLQSKENNRSQVAKRNTVGGDLQAFSNSGGYQISGNVIDGNLQCKSNNPAPTGGNNKVAGIREDQCKNL
jgi:hypothetical protein